jgi:hypothetical protein
MVNYIDMFVEVIIAVALFGPLQQFITDVNASGIPGTLLALVPVLYVILLVAAFAYQLKHKQGR